MAEKLKVSEKVKDTVSRLANKFKIAFSSSPEEEKLNTPTETLGAIYKLLVENRQTAKDIHNMEKKEHRATLNRSKLRQRELIKALSFKPKKVEVPKAQPSQPTKPTTTSTSKPPAKTDGTKQSTSKSETKSQPKTETKSEPKSETKSQPKAETKSEPKSQPKAETKSQPKAETKAEPKSQPKTETKAEPKSQPKTETKKETKVEKIPKKQPSTKSTEPIKKPPPETSTAPSTAARVIVGTGAAVASGVSLSQEIGDKIASHESAGTSERSYNIMNNASSKKRGIKDTMYDKYPLTQMTIGQVLDLAEERRKEFNPLVDGKRASIGVAMGKYQFMPSYVRGTAGNPGWAEQALGANWRNELFSPENQEKMHDILFRQEVRGLKARGVPVSEASIYMTHFLGGAGAAALYHAPDNAMLKDIMTPVQLASNPSFADMTVGEYKARITSSNGKKIGLSFSPIDKQRLDKFLANPPVVPTSNNAGQNVQSKSVSNNDAEQQKLREQYSAWKNHYDRTVSVTNQKQSPAPTSSKSEHDDRPAVLKKAANAK